MNTNSERSAVMLALAGFCALGALSAIVPAVAVALLVLLGLGVLAGIAAVIRAWHRTRPGTEPQLRRVTRSHTPLGPVEYKEVA
jgi:hypothetical protein